MLVMLLWLLGFPIVLVLIASRLLVSLDERPSAVAEPTVGVTRRRGAAHLGTLLGVVGLLAVDLAFIVFAVPPHAPRTFLLACDTIIVLGLLILSTLFRLSGSQVLIGAWLMSIGMGLVFFLWALWAS